MAKPSVKVFISYAHKDASFFEVFKEGIKDHFNDSAYFDFAMWEDSEIPLGSNWDDDIQENLGTADIALLCVSENFFASKYIESSEFNALKEKYTDTLIIPVFFDYCNINAWDNLAVKQFFKPSGRVYGQPSNDRFSFCDLVRSSGDTSPNVNMQKYFQDLVKEIEKAYISKNVVKRGFLQSDLSNRIVQYIIIAAILLSVVFIFYTLFSNGDSKKFNSIMGSAMFFGSFAAFTFNKKFSPAK
jgi:hypothetical protein